MSARRQRDGHDPSVVLLRLYVAGTAPNSARAVANLDAICRAHLDGCSTIEIVDALEEPLRALADGILVTPTLVKLSPDPPVTMIGDLSDHPTVLIALGVRGEVL